MERWSRRCRRVGAVLTALAMLLGLFPAWTLAADDETVPSPGVTFTFSDSGIGVSDESADGFSIDGTVLTLSASGTYGVTGSCAEGGIVVKGSVTGVRLVMEDLTLSCSTSAPLVCKGSSRTALWLVGSSVLTDLEDPDTEDTDSDFEGAAIKVKSAASLTIKGPGSLTADGSACKNGIKGAARSTVTVSGGEIAVRAANNGLAADGEVIVKGGTLDIEAGNDGIKSSPDEDDTESAGTITIWGGTIVIDAEGDGIQAAGDVTIYDGDLTIEAENDGIQTGADLTISGGTFAVTTFGGHAASGFDKDSMSCKGLKASSDADDPTNTITITGGTFVLDTADDAVHSDAYVEITGGKFDIATGDDGVHADTSLILGTEGGTVARDPDITVSDSYEGLEAGTVYIYSGRYHVTASDDGINAAGGSSEGTDPFPGGGGDHFRPGGGGPGGRMMGGGPSLMSGDDVIQRRPAHSRKGASLMSGGDYSLNVLGGNVYVDADGDGLDSNGTIVLTGGALEIWGQSSGDNEPLDYETSLTVDGATVFAAGCAGMGVATPSSGSQGYISYGGSGGRGGGFGGGFGGGSGSTIASGSLIRVTDSGSSTVYQALSPKSVSYIFFSAPDTESSWSIASGSGSVSCALGNDWTHDWDSGVVTAAATATASGIRTYTCSVCGATETETIPMLVTVPADEDDSGGEDETAYVVTFVTDDHSSIDLYYTQDYSSVSESGVTTAVARDGSTGAVDVSGDGQVNFTVVLDDGYTVTSDEIAIDGTYKNLKGPDDTGLDDTWRITKIGSDLTVMVTASGSGGDSGGEDETAYVVTFVTDDHSSIDLYYTQDYSSVSESGVTTAVARDGSTGAVDVSGDGQVNFTVVLDDGYTVTSDEIVIDGTYKNLKGPDDTGLDDTWRITKIGSDLTVTVTASGGSTAVLESIAVKDPPAKTVYAVGESFDPTGLTISCVYSDSSVTDLVYSDDAGMTFSGFDSRSAGPKIVTVTFGGRSADFSVTVSADAPDTDTTVPIPTAIAGLRYTGSIQVGVPASAAYTLSGVYSATDVGTYTATASLRDGYVWEDGTGTDKSVSWSIGKAEGPAAPAGLVGIAPVTEDGSDGRIAGTTSAMEISAGSAFTSASDCADGSTTGLTAGTWYVRYKESATTEAGETAVVEVPAWSGDGERHAVTFESNEGSAVEGQSIPDGGRAVRPDDPTKDGLLFDAWYSDPGLASPYDFDTAVRSDLVLYARWSDAGSRAQGCYVATAVYGSYDCPEVWTLRRFRDEVLAETWYGRLFIRLYYAVSPTAVELFGGSGWFQSFWRGRLDEMVSDLQARGFASTPYQDRDW